MRSARTELTLAGLACAAAAALALYAASRAWTVEVLARPAPLPPVHRTRSGGSVAPLLPALAMVGLAGAGALVATRGRVRRGLGAVLVGCGVGLVATTAYVLGTVPAVAAGAPALTIAAGTGLAFVGVVTLRRGGLWPGLGARYARPGVSSMGAIADQPARLWDAINRGEDPTKG
jgi:hypothetical protein